MSYICHRYNKITGCNKYGRRECVSCEYRKYDYIKRADLEFLIKCAEWGIHAKSQAENMCRRFEERIAKWHNIKERCGL
jgi:hypothetical protein